QLCASGRRVLCVPEGREFRGRRRHSLDLGRHGIFWRWRPGGCFALRQCAAGL
ncbi:hypothetical protein EV177_010356, partial [Coemansia sp. RSA 1804]